MKFILFYQPPCGTWYVHSHKLYATEAAAEAAAAKFLPPDTPISVAPISISWVDNLARKVGP